MRRRYHVIERTAASKKKIDKAPGKGLLPAIPLSSLHGVPASLCQEHRSGKPVQRSRIVGTTLYLLLFVGLCSPQNAVYIVLFSTDMQLNLQKCTAVNFEELFSNNPSVLTQRVFFGLRGNLLNKAIELVLVCCLWNHSFTNPSQNCTFPSL